MYGVPETGTVVGIFYNKALIQLGRRHQPPTDWATFTNDMALLAKAGKTAMSYAAGQPTAYQPVHMLYTIANHYVSAAASNAFVFHKRQHPSIDIPGYVQAAATFAAWTKDGYFPTGYQGLSDVQALNLFDQGKAGFFLEGDWYSSSVQQALGSKAGFWVPPVVTGGPGEGWSIPAKAPNPNAGAAVINALLSPDHPGRAAEERRHPGGHAERPGAGQRPRRCCGPRPPAGRPSVHSGNLVPYLDYATPDFLNQEMAGIQELQGGQITPSALMQSLQSDYTSYWSSRADAAPARAVTSRPDRANTCEARRRAARTTAVARGRTGRRPCQRPASPGPAGRRAERAAAAPGRWPAASAGTGWPATCSWRPR